MRPPQRVEGDLLTIRQETPRSGQKVPTDEDVALNLQRSSHADGDFGNQSAR
jgi:hypothetical protein